MVKMTARTNRVVASSIYQCRQLVLPTKTRENFPKSQIATLVARRQWPD